VWTADARTEIRSDTWTVLMCSQLPIDDDLRQLTTSTTTLLWTDPAILVCCFLRVLYVNPLHTFGLRQVYTSD